ncbi:hypothetical protein FACS1894126_2270 [Alphaproteobacteria bacterium]|nr:hypothetical protein FACS1894126_2270 [Alphaproteobacteria bacterium]
MISPLLANVAIHGLEYELKKALCEDLFQYSKKKYKVNRKQAANTISIVFYADDFVIIHERRA